MDDRHWRILEELERTFLKEFSNPTEFIQQFLTLPENLDYVNRLFSGETSQIFFICCPVDMNNNNDEKSHSLFLCDSLGDKQLPKDVHLFYIFNTNPVGEITRENLADFLLYGELHGSLEAISIMLLHSLFIPQLQEPSRNTQAPLKTEDSQLSILASKRIAGFEEALRLHRIELSSAIEMDNSMLLTENSKCPAKYAGQHSSRGHIGHYEEFVQQLIAAIWHEISESQLAEDAKLSIVPEELIKFYHDRHTVLRNLAERLKSKEMRTIFSSLLAAKSPLLKSWRDLDCRITECITDTRDRSKFLKSLTTPLTNIFATDVGFAQLQSGALPQLFQNLMQMQSASRYFTRNGFLPHILNMVGEQLVRWAKRRILSSFSTDGQLFLSMNNTLINPPSMNFEESSRTFWMLIFKNISENNLLSVPSLNQGEFRIMTLEQFVDTDSTSKTKKDHQKKSSPTSQKSEPIPRKLQQCWAILKQYKKATHDFMETLRLKSSKVDDTAEFTVDFKTLASFVTRLEDLYKNLRSLAALQHVCSFLKTTQQKTDTNANDIFLDGMVATIRPQLDRVKKEIARLRNNLRKQIQPWRQNLADDVEQKREERLAQEESWYGPEAAEQKRLAATPVSEIMENIEIAEPLISEEEIKKLESAHDILAEFYGPVNVDDHPSFQAVIKEQIEQIMAALQSEYPLDKLINTNEPVGSQLGSRLAKRQEPTRFPELLNRTLSVVTAYITVLHCMPLNFNEKLRSILKFAPLDNHQSVDEAIKRAMCQSLREFEDYMHVYRSRFNAEKNAIPGFRCCPPAAARLRWIRHLKSRIEWPMKVFERCRPIFSSSGNLDMYEKRVHLYNQIMLRMTEFERLVIDHWRAQLESYSQLLRVSSHNIFCSFARQMPILTKKLQLNLPVEAVASITDARKLTELGEYATDTVWMNCIDQLPKLSEYRNKVHDCLVEYERLMGVVRRLTTGINFGPGNSPGLLDHASSLVEVFRHSKVGQSLYSALHPATASITWEHCNIDAFVTNLTATLQEAQGRVHLMEDLFFGQLRTKLNDLGTALIFDDHELITEKWIAADLVTRCRSLIREHENRTRFELQRLEQTLRIAMETAASRQFSENEWKSMNEKALQSIGLSSTMELATNKATTSTSNLIAKSRGQRNQQTVLPIMGSSYRRKAVTSMPKKAPIVKEMDNLLIKCCGQLLADYHSAVRTALFRCYLNNLRWFLLHLSPKQANDVQRAVLLGNCSMDEVKQAEFDHSIDQISLKLMQLSLDDYIHQLTEQSDQPSQPHLVPAKLCDEKWSQNAQRVKFRFVARYLLPELTLEPKKEEATFAIRRIQDELVAEFRSFTFTHENLLAKSLDEPSESATALSNLISTSLADLDQIVEEMLHEYLPGELDFLWCGSPREYLHEILLALNIDSLDNLLPQSGINVRLKDTPQQVKEKWVSLTDKLIAEIHRIQEIETRLRQMTDQVQNSGQPLVILDIERAKYVLLNYCRIWKLKLCEPISDNAKRLLTASVAYRELVEQRLHDLNGEAGSLAPKLSGRSESMDSPQMTSIPPTCHSDSLNAYPDSMQLLNLLTRSVSQIDEVESTNHAIDHIYQPVEAAYAMLDAFTVKYSREEQLLLVNLRPEWENILLQWRRLSDLLLREKREFFLQELDRETKNFTIEVVQYRNAFEAEGRAVVGLNPTEASKRLMQFEQLQLAHETKFQTLLTISRLLGANIKAFPELDETAKELRLLNLLYELFGKFVKFDKATRATLWCDIDLAMLGKAVEGFWDDCLALPNRIKDWPASLELRTLVHNYLVIMPILQNLADRDFRVRHWMQVMRVCGRTFPLESNVFRTSFVLDLELICHKNVVADIYLSARKEAQLEQHLSRIEEEWVEQTLHFVEHECHGPVLLDVAQTQAVMNEAQSTHDSLAQMLNSRHVDPFREKVASWCEKLRSIKQILHSWLSAQDLWTQLEALFASEQDQEALKDIFYIFESVDRNYMKLMQKNSSVRNVLQCCFSADVPNHGVYRSFVSQFEACLVDTQEHLDSLIDQWPRIGLLPKGQWLRLLAATRKINPAPAQCSALNVEPFLTQLFAAVTNLKATRSVNLERAPSKQDKNKPLVSDYQIVGVSGQDGDELTLREPVSVTRNAFDWLKAMDKEIALTLVHQVNELLGSLATGKHIDQVISGYCCQVCTLGLGVLWTADAENAIRSVKSGEKRSLDQALRTFANRVQRIPTILQRTQSKKSTKHGTLSRTDVLRFENLISHGVYLTDAMRSIVKRRIRDVNDFEWRRNLRAYAESSTACYAIMDRKLELGGEFVGKKDYFAYTGSTERTATALLLHLQASIYGADTLEAGAVLLSGQPNFGKSTIVKHLANLLWKPARTVDCSVEALSRVSSGLPALQPVAESLACLKGWLVLQGVELANVELLSKFLVQADGIMQQIVKTAERKSSLTNGSRVFHGFGLVLTSSRWNVNLPFPNVLRASVKSMVRSISVFSPDPVQVIKAKLIAEGYRLPEELAKRLYNTCSVLAETVPGCYGVEYGKKAMLSMPGISAVIKHATSCRSRLAAAFQTSMKPSFIRNRSAERIPGHATASARKNRSASEPRAAAKLPEPASDPLGKFFGHIALSEVVPVSRELVKLGATRPNRRLIPTTLTLSPFARLEHACIAHALSELVASAFDRKDQVLCRDVISEMFNNLDDVAYLFGSLVRSGLEEAWRNVPNSSRKVSPDASVESEVQRGLAQLTALSITSIPESSVESKLRNSLIAIARERRLCYNQSDWLEMCVRLHRVATARKSMLLIGEPLTGKTTCAQSLIKALNATTLPAWAHFLSMDSSVEIQRNQRLFTIYPDSWPNPLTNLYGKEGIFAQIYQQNQTIEATTWYHFDGDISQEPSGWLDYLMPFMRQCADPTTRFLIESKSVANASPALMAQFGIVHFCDPYQTRDNFSQNATHNNMTTSKNHSKSFSYSSPTFAVNWRCLTGAWLIQRNSQESHALARSFEKTLDDAINFVMTIQGSTANILMCIRNLLNLLESLLSTEHKEPYKEIHLERLYLFSLLWTVGAKLSGTTADPAKSSEQQRFSDMLRSLTDALPDDDGQICLFDYFVDEMGEWDTWSSRLLEFRLNDQSNRKSTTLTSGSNPLAEVNSSPLRLVQRGLYETEDTQRISYLMEKLLSSGHSPLLVGGNGCGKSLLIDRLIGNLSVEKTYLANFTMSANTSARQLRDFMRSRLSLRYGLVHGAKEGKRFVLCMDDLSEGRQTTMELTRQILNGKFLIDSNVSPFEWHVLEDVCVCATMNSKASLYPRLLDRFIPVYMKRVESYDDWLALSRGLFQIHTSRISRLEESASVTKELNANRKSTLTLLGQTTWMQRAIPTDLFNLLNEANARFMTGITAIYVPVPLPGLQHHYYTPRTLNSLVSSTVEFAHDRVDPDGKFTRMEELVTFWLAECRRLVEDSFARTADSLFFDEFLQAISTSLFQAKLPALELEGAHFYAFSPTNGNQHVEHLPDTKDIEQKLTTFLEHTSLNAPNLTLDAMTVKHILKVYRVLNQTDLKSALLIGSLGSNLSILCRMAMHLADLPLVQVTTHDVSLFIDDMRNVVRKIALVNKPLGLILEAKDLVKREVLSTLTSLLMNGEDALLFKNDNMDGIVDAVRDEMRQIYGLTTNANSLGLEPALLSSAIAEKEMDAQVSKKLSNMQSMKINQLLKFDERRFIASRVTCNLRICLCLPYNHELLQQGFAKQSVFLRRMQCIWFRECSSEYLRAVAAFHSKSLILSRPSTPASADGEEEEEEAKPVGHLDKESVLIACLCDMHLAACELISCGPPDWSGQSGSQVEEWMTKSLQGGGATSAHDEASQLTTENSIREKSTHGTTKTPAAVLSPNLPYSRHILSEWIRNKRLEYFSKSNASAAFVAEELIMSRVVPGMTHFKRFLALFAAIFTKKGRKNRAKYDEITAVLLRLKKLQNDVENLKASLPELRDRFAENTRETEDIYGSLLEAVTEKARRSSAANESLDPNRCQISQLRKRFRLPTLASSSSSMQSPMGDSIGDLSMDMADEVINNEGQADAAERRSSLDVMLGDFTDDDPLLKLDNPDRYDAEFDKMRQESFKMRQQKLIDEMSYARNRQQTLQRLQQQAHEEVITCRNRIDRVLVDRLRVYQNPPALVGIVMEIMFLLMGKLLPQRSRRSPTRMNPAIAQSDAHSVSHFSTRSSRLSTVSGLSGSRHSMTNSITSSPNHPGGAQHKQIDLALWKYMRLSMMDPINFVEMLHNIAWEDGLEMDVVQRVEAYFSRNKEGQLGCVDEPTNREDTRETIKNPEEASPIGLSDDRTAASLFLPEEEQSSRYGITISGARYVSEEAANLVLYALAIIKYTKLRIPTRQSSERVNELEREMAALEADLKERERKKEEEEAKAEPTVPQPVGEPMADRPYITMEPEALEKLIADLEAQYDKSVDCKVEAKSKLEKAEHLLHVGKKVIKGLRIFEMKWEKTIEELGHGDNLLLANSLLVAGYLTYAGQLSINQAQYLMQNFALIICSRHLGPAGLAPLVKLKKEETSAPTHHVISSQNAIQEFDPKVLKLVCPINAAMREEHASICPGLAAFFYEGQQAWEVLKLQSVQAKSNEAAFREKHGGSLAAVVEQLALLSLVNLNCVTLSGWRVLHSESQLELLPFFWNPLAGRSVIGAWDLICDPTRRAVGWLMGLFMQDLMRRGRQLQVVRHCDLGLALESALMDGSTLIITDCDPADVVKDTKLMQVLRHCQTLANSTTEIVKLNLSLDPNTPNEVECHHSFRLYLHTCDIPARIPLLLNAIVRLVHFPVTRTCMSEEFTDRLVALQKNRIHNELTAIVTTKLDYRKQLLQIEQEILQSLSCSSEEHEKEERLLEDHRSIELIFAGLEKRVELLESQIQLEIKEESLLRARNGFIQVGRRAAICCEVAGWMRGLSPWYCFPRDFFLVLFDQAIVQSDRTSLDAVIQKITKGMYDYVVRGLHTADRLLFSLMLAMEVFCSSKSANNSSSGLIGEREFIISPQLAATTLSAFAKETTAAQKLLSGNALESSSITEEYSNRATPSLQRRPDLLKHLAKLGGMKSLPDVKYLNPTLKKPFDWMINEQFVNIQTLAAHFSWFAPIFDRFYKDGKENQWRLFMEHEKPETCPLPDRLDDRLGPLKRFALVRAVRPDRMLQASRVFITAVLGREYKYDCMLNSEAEQAQFIRLVNPQSPILLVHDKSLELAVDCFDAIARMKEAEFTSISVSDNGPETTAKVMNQMRLCSTQGKWILVQCNLDNEAISSSFSPQNCTTLKDSTLCTSVCMWLRRTLARLPNGRTPSPRFRCFITVHCNRLKSGPRFLWPIRPHAMSDGLPEAFQQTLPRLVCDPISNVVPHMLRCIKAGSEQRKPLESASRSPSPLCVRQNKSGSNFSTSNDWMPITAYHNLALLHAAIQLRSSFPINGFSDGGKHLASGSHITAPGEHAFVLAQDVVVAEAMRPFTWISSQANTVDPVLPTLLPGQRSVSWQSMRFILANVLFGGCMLTASDQNAIATMIDHFINLNATKRDWNFAKGMDYKLPNSFYHQSPRNKLTMLSQLLEQSSPFLLDRPELAQMLFSPETYLGEDQYIFSRYSWLLNAANESDTLTHTLTNNFGFNLLNVNSQSLACHTTYPLNPSSSHPLVFAHGVIGRPMCLHGTMNRTLGNQLMLSASGPLENLAGLSGRKEFDLLELCQNLLSRLPRPPPTNLVQSVLDQLHSNAAKNTTALLGGATINNSMASMLPRRRARKVMPHQQRSKRDQHHLQPADNQQPTSAKSAFAYFVASELRHFTSVLAEIRGSLTRIAAACVLDSQVSELSSGKWASLREHHVLTEADVEAAAFLIRGRVPTAWLWPLVHPDEPLTKSGRLSPAWLSLTGWLNDLSMRSAHLEKLATLGRHRMPSFCLGAFAYPRAFLGVLMLEAQARQSQASSSAADADLGQFNKPEQLTFRCEVTGRDKDHLRDPPAEGVFIHGLHLWGCGWDRVGCQLSDNVVTPRVALAQVGPGSGLSAASMANSPLSLLMLGQMNAALTNSSAGTNILTTQLPVIHVTVVTATKAGSGAGNAAAGEDFDGPGGGGAGGGTQSTAALASQATTVKREQSDQDGLLDQEKCGFDYATPIFVSRLSRQTEPMFELNLMREGVPASLWSLRGVFATTRPY